MGENFNKWQLYMRDISSPQSFIDFGWYYLISAALQRRVWVGPDHQKLFPNIYVILVGEPGIGKGLVIKQILEFLKEHKLQPPGAPNINDATDINDAIASKAVEQANYLAATSIDGKQQVAREQPLLIPIAANATTFESLVNSCAMATRRINYKAWNPKAEKLEVKIYTHASLCFCLEEISSLFHKEAAKVVNFLITAYDCGDYEYKTKTAGTDFVKRPCLNFFGGTTPGFLESTFNDKLLAEGFSSRTWFIYAQRNRKYQLWMPELTPEQAAARVALSAHIKKLIGLYGQVKYTPDATEYLAAWWERSNSPDNRRPNTNEKLNAYYSRKNIHVQKLAMAIHFSEDASVAEDGHTPANPITLETVKKAMEMLDSEERFMHLALNFDGANPLHKVSKKICKYLKQQGSQSTDDLLLEFWSDCNQEELNAVLDHLRRTQQITLNSTTMKWQTATIKAKE